MYISLKDSCSTGFNKWADAHQLEIKKDVLAEGGDQVVTADPGLDKRLVMSSERAHHPALMPGPDML